VNAVNADVNEIIENDPVKDDTLSVCEDCNSIIEKKKMGIAQVAFLLVQKAVFVKMSLKDASAKTRKIGSVSKGHLSLAMQEM